MELVGSRLRILGPKPSFLGGQSFFFLNLKKRAQKSLPQNRVHQNVWLRGVGSELSVRNPTFHFFRLCSHYGFTRLCSHAVARICSHCRLICLLSSLLLLLRPSLRPPSRLLLLLLLLPSSSFAARVPLCLLCSSSSLCVAPAGRNATPGILLCIKFLTSV